jgi:sugar lactone lactonase YvrE
MDIEVVLEAGAIIGEPPTWAAEEQALYWIDVKKPALYRFEPATGGERCWPLPSDIGGFALLPRSSGALVALRQGIFSLDFAGGALTPLAPPPFDPAQFRFNEGACDAAGRFWIGVMFDPLQDGGPARKASLHSFTRETGLRPEPDASELHNGMGWGADGRRFYLSHTLQHEIFEFPFDVETGRIGAPTLFARVPEGDGVPDGAAVDDRGGYWCALHGGGRLRRYTAEGRIDRDIELPVSQPTMCAFAGDALDILYVTSASDNLGPEQRRREPLAGALLRLRPGETGVVRRCTLR